MKSNQVNFGVKVFIFILLFNFTHAMAKDENPPGGVPCNDYETCLKEFGSAFLLSKNVSNIAQKVFKNNWRTLIDDKNILFKKNTQIRDKGCSLVHQLVPLPPDSPMAKLFKKHFESLAQGIGTVHNKDYIFERDIQMLRNVMNPQPGFSMVIEGAETKEKVENLFSEQKKWENENAKTFLKYQNQNLRSFKSICAEDNTKDIINAKLKILKENREISALKNDLDQIQNECSEQFQLKIFNTQDRYKSNSLSNSRFTRLKDFAIALCSPVSAIRSLAGDKNECTEFINDVYSIISPECEERLLDNAAKGNLCNGLHRTLKKAFIENPIYDQYLRTFANKMRLSFDKKDKRDILSIALESSNGDRLAAVRLLGLVGHDEINTTMRSIRENLIQTGQYDRLARARDLYTRESHVHENEDERYDKTQVIEGNMTLFKKLIKGGSPIDSNVVTGRYYHFVASTVVACELKAKKYSAFSSRFAASMAGKIYEAYDFKSHISNGVSLSDSIDNFVRDTAKHSKGGELGSKFCP